MFWAPLCLLRSHPALQFTHLDLVEPLGRGIETRTSLESGISSKDLPAAPPYFFFDKTVILKKAPLTFLATKWQFCLCSG